MRTKFFGSLFVRLLTINIIFMGSLFYLSEAYSESRWNSMKNMFKRTKKTVENTNAGGGFSGLNINEAEALVEALKLNAKREGVVSENSKIEVLKAEKMPTVVGVGTILTTPNGAKTAHIDVFFVRYRVTKDGTSKEYYAIVQSPNQEGRYKIQEQGVDNEFRKQNLSTRLQNINVLINLEINGEIQFVSMEGINSSDLSTTKLLYDKEMRKLHLNQGILKDLIYYPNIRDKNSVDYIGLLVQVGDGKLMEIKVFSVLKETKDRVIGLEALVNEEGDLTNKLIEKSFQTLRIDLAGRSEIESIRFVQLAGEENQLRLADSRDFKLCGHFLESVN